MANNWAGRWVAAWVALVPAFASAGEWETISAGPIAIKTRSKPGSSVKEVWAEGDVDASIRDVQDAILDAEGYPRFMPYVRESKRLGPPAADKSQLVYSRVELPIVPGRDYVVRVTVDRDVHAGDAEFMNRWVSVPDAVPQRANVVRLRTNEGSWHAYQKNGRTHLVYRFAVDPGGWVPSFVIDMGNRTAVPDTFHAIEREARRRGEERTKNAAR